MQSKNVYPDQSSVFTNGKLATVYLAFFFLFPGFFFYNTFLGLGVIGAFLGGYFSVVSLAFIFPLIFFYLVEVKRKKTYFSKTDFYYLIFLIYCFFVVAINFIAGANTLIARSHFLEILYSINGFIIFKMIALDDKKLMTIMILSLMAMSAIVFYFSVDGSFYLKSLGTSTNPESLATYQGFARSYLITFVVIISFVRSITARILMYAIAVPTLFINTARSEFVALLFLIPIIEIYYAKHKLKMASAMFVIFAIVSLNFEYILERLPDNRVLELIDLSQSSSANLRHHLTDQALQTINNNPILGDYASYAVGEYAHNILSAWVDFGLFGFIYILIIFTWATLRLFFEGFFLKTKPSDFLLAVSLMSITFLWMLTSKTFFDITIAASLGAYAKYRCGEKNE